MKTKLKKLSPVMTLLMGMSVVSGAEAAAAFSAPTSSNLDLVFAQKDVPISVNISPAAASITQSLMKDKTLFATATISTPSAARLGIRWTPGVGTPGSNLREVTLSANGDATSQVNLAYETTVVANPVTLDGISMLVANDAATEFVANINISGDQLVKAGTYRMSLDAAVYTP